jgi:hypothetical protein
MEGAMGALTRIGIAGLLAVGISAASLSTAAQARDGFNGALFGGMAAGALVGGALAGAGRYAPPPPYYGPAPVYAGPRYYESDCYVTRRPVYNSWGDFVGYNRVRECD